VKQPFLNGFESLGVKQFGGSLLKGNPREARPIAVKRPMHVVLRSGLATGPRSMLKPGTARRIEALVRRRATESGVRVYRFANSGNHLHLVLVSRSRAGFQRFLRAVTGLIARVVLGVERGRPLGVRFWDARPFTRIVEWGREYRIVANYVLGNHLEAVGFPEDGTSWGTGPFLRATVPRATVPRATGLRAIFPRS
jgi:REP element-mobilizing transposase RayT